MRVDATGKISLDHIYTSPDPRDYFSTLRELDYFIPQIAKPHFARVIEEYRDARDVPVPQILDLGCSYGINAALLKCDLDMADLYDRYAGPGADGVDRAELLAADRELTRRRSGRGAVRVTGLDISENALSYAMAAGFLDDMVHADLERDDPTPLQREKFAAADLVISTGCLGYVGRRTISRIVSAQTRRPPWMAHFVLRMFPFDPIEESLAANGYDTVKADGVFRQRRFATGEEQEQVLDTLSAAGVDPSGRETEGWFYAELYLSRPQ